MGIGIYKLIKATEETPLQEEKHQVLFGWDEK